MSFAGFGRCSRGAVDGPRDGTRVRRDLRAARIAERDHDIERIYASVGGRTETTTAVSVVIATKSAPIAASFSTQPALAEPLAR